ncbi:tetratricopeptide repeat protein [uncultured Fibrobacter sp.]|uniref:tetratricopeptide repeat protein n=1 Tax=uncultured Fibrobacter sp. TaxID=261512 RepID=UPI0025F51B83|nr:tetratricopeptide repeat protein [uncultured Fibrobacter sp.]
MVSLPFAADPRMEQGARFEAKGEYEMALGEYRSILAEDPKNATAYFAAAEVRMKMKDYSGALANYRLAYKFEPTMSAAYEGAAKVYEALNQKAKADAERAKDPKNRPAEEVAAPVEEAAPAPEPVKVAEPAPEPKPVEAKPEPKPEPPKAAPVEQPKAEPAKVAEPSRSEAPAANDPFEKGRGLLAEGKYKEAAQVWREILAKKPGDAGAYFYAGVTRYEMGEYDKAEFNLKKGAAFKERGNDANYYLALVYKKTGKADLEKKALAAYLKKSSPGATYRKEVEDRLAEIKAAAEAAKADASADTATETAPVEVAQDTPAAPAPKSRVAVTTEENTPIAKANIYFKAGSFESALQMYRTVVESEASPDERYFAMLQMGNIYRELRDFHSAVSRYREVVQQYPDSDWATEAERALEDAVWLEKHASELPRRTR